MALPPRDKRLLQEIGLGNAMGGRRDLEVFLKLGRHPKIECDGAGRFGLGEVAAGIETGRRLALGAGPSRRDGSVRGHLRDLLLLTFAHQVDDALGKLLGLDPKTGMGSLADGAPFIAGAAVASALG
jgi:hypothetical protein